MADCNIKTAPNHACTAMHCPHCQDRGPHHTGPGTRVHFARVLCGRCQRFLRWLPKPRQEHLRGQEGKP